LLPSAGLSSNFIPENAPDSDDRASRYEKRATNDHERGCEPKLLESAESNGLQWGKDEQHQNQNYGKRCQQRIAPLFPQST
jgi:hypothetical protein